MPRHFECTHKSSNSYSFQSEKFTQIPFRIVFKEGLYLGSSITHVWARSCSRGSLQGVSSDSLSQHLCCSVFCSSGSSESLCRVILPNGCKHQRPVSGVCPLLDIPDSAFLLQHALPPHGGTGALPHHTAAAHHVLHR